MTSAFLPLIFTPPLEAPARGLYDAVTWIVDGTDTARFVATNVDIQRVNSGLEQQFGVWGEDWCVDPDNIESTKYKYRLDNQYRSFEAMTVYGFDHNYCGDMTDAARAEVRQRALDTLTTKEQNAVENVLGSRMLGDAPYTQYVGNIVQAVSHLENELMLNGQVGYLHASPKWAAYLAQERLNIGGRSPLGHTWVFGGGYAGTLDWTLVATTQPYGWRTGIAVRDAYKYDLNQYVVVAERSVVVGYEAVFAAAVID